jgi:hypothetical protein
MKLVKPLKDNIMNFYTYNIFDANMMLKLPDVYHVKLNGIDAEFILAQMAAFSYNVFRTEKMLIFPLFNDDSIECEDNLFIIRIAAICALCVFANEFGDMYILDKSPHIECITTILGRNEEILYINPNDILGLSIELDNEDEPIEVIFNKELNDYNIFMIRFLLRIADMQQIVEL